MRMALSERCHIASLVPLSKCHATYKNVLVYRPKPLPFWHHRLKCRKQLVARPAASTAKNKIIDALVVEPATPQAQNNGLNLTVTFDNDSDQDATVLNVSGQDQSDLLMQLTTAINALELTVLSAMIESREDGQVIDVFRVVRADGTKIPEKEWKSVSESILNFAANSNRSGKPAIYGAAAAEAPQVKPLTLQSSLESDATALESAAAEMAEATAALISVEREIVRLQMQPTVDGLLWNSKQSERAEAAALLERRMAAMEAVLASRRTNALQAPPEPLAARGPGADLRFQSGGGTSTGPAAGNGFEILLQGFNWESCNAKDWYQVVQEWTAKYAEVGFTSIWLPPPTDSVSPQGYLPRDLYVLNSRYGSEESLRSCINLLHEYNLKAIADIVINHRCAHSQSPDKKWNIFGGRLAWDPTVICANNPSFGGTGAFKPQDDYSAAPNIDHSQDRVREDLKKWLKWLRSIGYDGWRFDYVKGYDGLWTKEYIDASVPLMAFGEYWDTCEYTDGVLNYNQDAHRQRTVNWCDRTGGTAAAFDFTTKGILQEAVGRREYWRLVDAQGRPPGVIGMWPSRAITFIENHDTGSTLRHWPFPWGNVLEGYAYILTHPGTPCVFYDHFHDANYMQALTKLVGVRKKNGINARSKVTVRKAVAELYAATIDDKVAVKMGPGDWSPNHVAEIAPIGWTLAVSGHQFAVWVAGK